MQSAGNAVALATVLFLIVRIFGALLPGIGAEIAVMLLALALPLLFLKALGALRLGKERLCFSPRQALPYLPLLPPFIVTVSMLAVLSSWLADLLGLNRSVEPSGTLAVIIVTSALLPAFVEELFCRHLCLIPFGKSAAASVWLSATVFAALHMNVAQIPYAFAAGLFLGALTVSSGSVWLAVLFHFFNNLLSVLVSYLPPASIGFSVTLAVFLASSLVSLALLLLCTECRVACRRVLQAVALKSNDRAAMRESFRSLLPLPILFCLLFSFL